jgi:hypothetical protein
LDTPAADFDSDRSRGLRTPAPFLSARWERLILVTYAVNPAMLAAHVPPGCVLDEHPAWPGRGLVSLVAFEFLDTRVKGVRWRVPGTGLGRTLVDFPEINLRFYVRGPVAGHDHPQRGVCFIKELVPSRVVSLVARLVYNEPYECASMRAEFAREGGMVTIRHRWSLRGEHELLARGHDRPQRPHQSSVEHFFKEHSVGFGVSRRGRLVAYAVEHGAWDVWPVAEHRVRVGFAGLYGEQWRELEAAEPVSVVLALGGPVVVYPKA